MPGLRSMRGNSLGLGITLVLLLAIAPAAADGSGARAFWSSLLIPGLGQHLNGQSRAAARFFATEMALWSGHLGLAHVADIRERNFRTHAAVHAGARPNGKSKQYFDDLGFYESYHQHNRFAAVEDGVAAELYPDAPEFFWEWDDEAARMRFRELRNSAQSSDRQALFATSLILANHLISAVHAARRAARSSSASDTPADATRSSLSGPRGNLELRLSAQPRQSTVALIHRF